MQNLIEDRQRSQTEKGKLLGRAIIKADDDLILFFHFPAVYAEIMDKELSEDSLTNKGLK